MVKVEPEPAADAVPADVTVSESAATMLSAGETRN